MHLRLVIDERNGSLRRRLSPIWQYLCQAALPVQTTSVAVF